MSKTNKLIDETSPYLLQHAHNPVNWYPWSEEALNEARQKNKPILVSIGYSACHWCHVMERESFEDEATAEIMNEHFVNIKIDREERPDLDHIYMDAVQAMTGSGGWPLNVFLTPEGKPFYGGTYFPPQAAYNRPSWQDVLMGVSKAFTEKRHEIDAQAENLTEHLLKSNAFGLQANKEADLFSKEKTGQAFENIIKTADKEWGGFGKAPKFPQTFTIQYLLRYHHSSGNEKALQQALLSLDKMIEGGIYDQVGGGFARYSTDTEWLAPHFEKMLYDNALLVSVLSEAYQLTKKERYKEVIEETIAFVQRELLHDSGGFYAALDADSEGEEGKFYVWSYEEVRSILKEDADLFCEYYDVTEKGNWEETNILRVREPLEKFADRKNIGVGELKETIARAGTKLLGIRNNRVRPGLDDKIILGWNALMNTACSKAFMATGNAAYKQMAIDNMQCLLEKFTSDAGGFYHTWKNDQAKYPAFLDDYAFLIQALLHLQEITAETKWLDKAAAITEHVISGFSEEETGFFFYTGRDQKDIIVRKKEVYDGAVPSGNAVMALNLHHLGILMDRPDWRGRSETMLSSLGQAIIRYPGSFGVWACLLLEKIRGTNEIAIIGKDYASMVSELYAYYIPHKVLMASGFGSEQYPLLRRKEGPDSTNVYLCKDYVCDLPVSSVKALISLIHRATGA
ncbi:MAG TPA: thioredoxin domain-containing protein [Chitinophagaceae bacterium]